MEGQERKEEWDRLLKDLPHLQKQTSPWYGKWSVDHLLRQPEQEQLAYLTKYWPDVEERGEVRELLAAASGAGEGTAGGTARGTAGGTEPPLKRRKIVTDRESLADLISTIPRGQGVTLPSYQFKLHDRENQLTTITDSIVRNFRFRSRGQSPLYDTVLIPGGFCFGKSRLGFETQHIPKSVLEASHEFGNLYPEEQGRLLEALAEPVYIYIDFGNGQQFDQALDWHNNQAVPAGVRLGVRLASRGLLGMSLSSLLSAGWETCIQLDAVLVLSQIVHEALAKRQQGANLDDRGGDKEHEPVKKPIVCVIIHLDEYQLYIERAARLLGGDFAEGRTYFKDMVKTILEFMKSISQSQLGGEFFVIPVCTGTSASDVSFLPTESNRNLVSLTPLTNGSVDEIALECYGEGFSTTNPWWKMAVGDSMGIPRFIEWMLEGKENSWSDTLSNAILTRDALRNLEYYGGPDSVERLIALALVQQPVSRKDSLGDAGTIGDIERPGTIYLVPVPSSGDMYHVGLPLPVCRVLCLELEANGRQAPIPPELLFAPTPVRPWYWQDFENFYPHYQRLLVQSLKTLKCDQSVKVTDLFRGALGLTRVLDYEVMLPPSTVFEEKDKFLVKKSDKAEPAPILCRMGLHLQLEAGIFACAEGNALIDHRFACFPSSNDAPSAAFFIQTKHTMKGTSVSASFIKTWYTETMTALQAYTEQYFVVLVFVTNREFKGNAYDKLFSKGCTNLLLLVNDIYAQPTPSLAKFLGPTFAQRALYAPDKSE